MSVLELPSRGKINLFLEVLGRRDDGFHNLDTIFCQIDWCDDLVLTVHDQATIRLHCQHPDFPTGPDNLIVKALSPLIKQRGLIVDVKKRLPMGGGLGGGSSNAATALKAGLALLDLKMSAEQQAAHALDLGSDVPFFLQGGCQRGLGRGELLTVQKRPQLDLVLVTPPIHCSTAQVFKAFKASAKAKECTEMLAAIERDDAEGIARALFNRLQEPSFKLWPELESYRKELLRGGCLGALMSGSGSSLFGVARDRDHALTLADELDFARAVTTQWT
jgi:4-diphosphocytidyl-2-C-methyl-D-erythritol kinase